MSAPASAMITSAPPVLIQDRDDQLAGAMKGLHHHLDPRGELVHGVGVLVDQV